MWTMCLSAQTYSDRLKFVSLSPDAKIAIGASKKEIVFWDITKQSKIFERKGNFVAYFLKKINKVLLAGNEQLELLNPQTFQTEKTFALNKEETFIDIEPSEQYVLIRRSNGSLRKITLPGLEEQGLPEHVKVGRESLTTFHPSGRFFFVLHWCDVTIYSTQTWDVTCYNRKLNGKDLHPEVMTCLNFAVAKDHFFVGHNLHIGAQGSDVTRYQFVESEGKFIGMGVLALNEMPEALKYDHTYENLYITTLEKNFYKLPLDKGKPEKILKTERFINGIAISEDKILAILAGGFSKKDNKGGAVYVIDLNKKKIIAELN